MIVNCSAHVVVRDGVDGEDAEGFSRIEVVELGVGIVIDHDKELGVLFHRVIAELVGFAGGFVGDAGVQRCDSITVCVPGFTIFAG